MAIVLAILKWLALAVLALLVGGFLFALVRFGPVPLTLAWADPEPNGPPATPAIAEWPDDPAPLRADILDTLGDEVFGPWPDDSRTRVLSVERGTYAGGELAHVELEAEAVFAGAPATTRPFGVSLVMPEGRPDAPVILWGSFSPRGNVLPGSGLPQSSMPTMAETLLTGVFGRYIQTPPIADILGAGYGFAVVHPPEFLPDSRASVAELDRLSAGRSEGEPRWGAVAAWAWGMGRALDALEAEGLARGPVIAGGHSRYGKSALLLAAHDPRIDGVISHQSGTGGASLSRGKRGETVAQIVESYPHWFAPGYSEDGLTLDQHHLLAAIAPRPILLGNARRDVWSDPNGALRAARGAAVAWGVEPPERMDAFDPASPLALWMRPGTHGIVEEDWPAFLAWMGAHFG